MNTKLNRNPLVENKHFIDQNQNSYIAEEEDFTMHVGVVDSSSLNSNDTEVQDSSVTLLPKVNPLRLADNSGYDVSPSSDATQAEKKTVRLAGGRPKVGFADTVSNTDINDRKTLISQNYDGINKPGRNVKFNCDDKNDDADDISSYLPVRNGTNSKQPIAARRDSLARLRRPQQVVEPLSPEKLQQAAIYIKDCLNSREEEFKTDVNSMRAYELYNHPVFPLAVVICCWMLLLLAIFEDPSLSNTTVPFWATMIVEACILLFFAFRLLHKLYFSERHLFFKNWMNIVIIVSIILTVLDMICYSVWRTVASATVASYAVRWSRPIRPVFLIMFPESRRIRQAMGNIWRTLPDILHVLILWLCSIGLFALMAFKMFKDRNLHYSNGDPYFSTYFDAYWDLYVLVTTANNPDVMMPAYDFNSWFALFFVCYEVVNLYIFMNVVLATIYNNYKEHLKDEVRQTVYMHRRLLNKAFDVAVVYTRQHWVITSERWHQLIKAVFPKMHDTKINLMLFVLDDNENDMLSKAEFLQLRDLFTIEIVDVDASPTFLEKHCRCLYLSSWSVKFRRMVMNKYFSYLFDLLIVSNAVCIALDVSYIEWFYMIVFTFEIFAYIYAYGPKKYVSSNINLFDCLIIGSAWVITIGHDLILDETTRGRILDFLLILRIIRIIRVAQSVQGFRVILTTIAKILPFIVTYGSVLVLLYYVYAIIGMELFKGQITFYGYENLTEATIYCGNARLNGSEFFIKRYCKNNFNNIFHAYVVLYDLMVVNQWHELTNGFILANNKLYRIFFFSFHISCVVILVNIFAAFILEIFLLEITLTKDKVESRIQTKLDELQKGEVNTTTAKKLAATDIRPTANDSTDSSDAESTSSDLEEQSRQPRQSFSEVAGLRFKLKKKSNMRAEYVLQQMFENEIDPTDFGEENDMTPAPHLQPRRLTLSML